MPLPDTMIESHSQHLVEHADSLCPSASAAEHVAALLSMEQVRNCLDVLSRAARERLNRCSSDFIGLMGGAEFNVMTGGERLLRQALLFRLPSFAEEREAATERIRERIAARRRGVAQRPFAAEALV